MKALRLSHGARLEVLAALRVAWADRSSAERAMIYEEIAQSLKAKRSVKAAKTQRDEKRKTRKTAMAALRAEVFWRAEASCEARGCKAEPTELDHQFGRVRVKQKASNCRALCQAHHRAKTNSVPSAEFWLKDFIEHCQAHGYVTEEIAARSRLESLQIQGRAHG